MLPSVPAGQDFFPILKSHANRFLVLPTGRMSLPPLSMRKRPCQGLSSPAPAGVQVTRNMSINLDASHSQDVQHGASNCSPIFPPTVWHHHKFRLGENVYSSLFFAPHILSISKSFPLYFQKIWYIHHFLPSPLSPPGLNYCHLSPGPLQESPD